MDGKGWADKLGRAHSLKTIKNWGKVADMIVFLCFRPVS